MRGRVPLLAALLLVAAALPALLDSIHHRAPLPSLAAGVRSACGGLFARLGGLAPTGHGEYRTAQHDEESHHADPNLQRDHAGDEERDTYEKAATAW